ncbi:hypothetical protein ACIFOC_01118 [Leucobacter aridicollis]|uniref:Uncharacterized protein n=1 Tax=Leucobacter aridicollis TaxID=283878 RepID=A0A852RLY6_9MICO|nr:hypothetical protein [Leucobacter aridicollis]MBL3681303.1 hypothetical protein [Leucobacter aridicollis]NYD27672.1 hypothetical protein [Leucobacter aridicollis]RKQ84407.1 hypothetical protein U746_2635 [Mycolicibacterium mucogenicum 261Sha1.1M5]
MSEVQRQGEKVLALPTDRLMPHIQRFGQQAIEFTFLGPNMQGQPTWIMWNANEPYLIGMLSQGKMGYHFEQRTGDGVQRLENISLNRVQRALGG